VFALLLETELGEEIRRSMGMYEEDELNDASGMSNNGVCISWYWRT